MTKNKLILIVGFVLCSFNVYAGTSLSAQYQCYKSLIGKAYGANYLLENDTILLPGNDGSKKGFYLYSEKTAFFCELPAQPHDKNSQMDYYYLNLKIGDTKSVYMTYSDNRQDRTNPVLGTSSEPAPAVKKYEPANCRAKLTDETRASLTTELKARASSVYSTFKSLQDYTKKRFNRDEQPDSYKTALDSCSNVSELNDVISAELAKFPVATQQNNQQPSGAVR